MPATNCEEHGVQIAIACCPHVAHWIDAKIPFESWSGRDVGLPGLWMCGSCLARSKKLYDAGESAAEFVFKYRCEVCEASWRAEDVAD